MCCRVAAFVRVGEGLVCDGSHAHALTSVEKKDARRHGGPPASTAQAFREELPQLIIIEQTVRKWARRHEPNTATDETRQLASNVV